MSRMLNYFSFTIDGFATRTNSIGGWYDSLGFEVVSEGHNFFAKDMDQEASLWYNQPTPLLFS